jgi:ElaB/YqjD/DUF883 family membrane-anchored ribosome-binding protein
MEQMHAEKIPSNVEEIPGRGETFTAARERFDQVAHYADQQVRSSPWIALGVGFGVGLVLGALMGYAAVPKRRWY